MKKTKQRSRIRQIIDTAIYCAAVILLFFSVVLFLQEFQYIPMQAYTDPPPSAPTKEPQNTAETQSPYPYAAATPTEPALIPPTVSAAPTESLPSDSPGRTQTPDDTPKEEFDYSLLHPVKLYFVDRRISCDIVPVGLTSRYEMQTVRSAYDTGWLFKEPYVLPGDVGKAVIAGHNRWAGHNGTFSVLKKLQPGEQIAVEMSDGYARYFAVDEITECGYDDNSIMEPIYDRAVLVLITCKGDWDSVLHMSRTRVIAICSPIQ